MGVAFIVLLSTGCVLHELIKYIYFMLWFIRLIYSSVRKEKKDNLVWEWCPKAEFIYAEKM